MRNKESSIWHQTILPSLSLFTSFGTLVCCALPVLMVKLGMGAALAGLIGAAPWITVISDYKLTIFVVAGVLLLIAAFMVWYTRNAPCPVDSAKAMRSRMRYPAALYWVPRYNYIVSSFYFFATSFYYKNECLLKWLGW